MSIIDKIEYSVCEDCLTHVAYGPSDNTSAEADAQVELQMRIELDGKKGHFVTGVEPTEDDPEGYGHDEFSSQECELCRSGLAGSRHGVTLLLEGE